MMATKKAKDLSPKSAGTVKGGRNTTRASGNHNFTLVRQAKPTVKKDLPPSKNPKGGRKSGYKQA
jgi:hypothetical protein